MEIKINPEVMEKFKNCFDKHGFQELNDIDVPMLYKVFKFFIDKYGITDDTVIFDIGCNAGSFVKVVNHFNATKNVHCFEPHPVISKVTKQIYPFVKMNEFCLGNIDGNIDIHIPELSVGLSSVVNRPVFSQLGQNIHVLNVECKKLDTYCKLNNIDHIDFMKIDTEGSEKYIIEGAIEMIKNKKIKCGIFEIGNTLYDANTHENEIVTILENNGYKIDKTLSNADYFFYLE